MKDLEIPLLPQGTLPPPPNHPIPEGFPPNKPNALSNANSFSELAEPSDIQAVGVKDPSYDPLADHIDIIPAVRTSIDEFHLPASDQEIFFGDSDEAHKHATFESNDYEEPSSAPDFLHADQDIISEFEYAFDNHKFKEIKSY